MMAACARPTPSDNSNNKAKVNGWDTAFPKNQDTEKNRLRFLARMGYISIAHYLLYRKLVPIAAYKRRRVEDLVFYVFNSEKPWGNKLAEMMKGLRQAIEKKYVESAYVMINEDKENPKSATEVFTVYFSYSKETSFNIVNDLGQSIVSMHYVNEKSFRSQAKHLIKKLSVTKSLKELAPGATPSLKLTYNPETPNDYQPPGFKHCEDSYTFDDGTEPTFYDYGSVTTNETAIAVQLESVYITKDDIGRLEEALFDEQGVDGEQQHVDPHNVTEEGEGMDENGPGECEGAEEFDERAGRRPGPGPEGVRQGGAVQADPRADDLPGPLQAADLLGRPEAPLPLKKRKRGCRGSGSLAKKAREEEAKKEDGKKEERKRGCRGGCGKRAK